MEKMASTIFKRFLRSRCLLKTRRVSSWWHRERKQRKRLEQGKWAACPYTRVDHTLWAAYASSECVRTCFGTLRKSRRPALTRSLQMRNTKLIKIITLTDLKQLYDLFSHSGKLLNNIFYISKISQPLQK